MLVTFNVVFYSCFISLFFFLKTEDGFVTEFVKVSQLVILNHSPFFWLTNLATQYISHEDKQDPGIPLHYKFTVFHFVSVTRKLLEELLSWLSK